MKKSRIKVSKPEEIRLCNSVSGETRLVGWIQETRVLAGRLEAHELFINMLLPCI